MRRNMGKMLISLAAIITAVAPILADWNDSHLFSPQWSPHARFHGAVSLGMTTSLSSVALWLLWRRSPDQDAPVTVAAAIPMAYWALSFLLHSSQARPSRTPGIGWCGSWVVSGSPMASPCCTCELRDTKRARVHGKLYHWLRIGIISGAPKLFSWSAHPFLVMTDGACVAHVLVLSDTSD